MPSQAHPPNSRWKALRACASWLADSRNVWIHSVAIAVLCALIALAYTPSLGHGPRQDQWPFLIDTIDQVGFLDTFARSYSYARTRAVMPGDYQLFRPVLYALLSAEKAVFGNNFSLWQAFGIALHCLAVVLFLQILLAVHQLLARPPSNDEDGPGWLTERVYLRWLAYGLALFFSLNVAIMEMVIWSHINGYLLFVVLVLGATLICLSLLTKPNASATRQTALVGGAFLLVFLAAFTHEIGQFFAVLTGAVLGLGALAAGRRRRAAGLFALFASILVVYQGVNCLDRLAHPSEPDVSMQLIVERAASTQTLYHAYRYFLYTVAQPFLPSHVKWWYFGRVAIDEPVLTAKNLYLRDPMNLSSLAVLGGLCILALRGTAGFLRAEGKVKKLLIVALPLSLFVLHGAATVLGRMNVRLKPDVLSINSYYTYLPLLGVLIALYGLCVCSLSASHGRWRLALPVHAVVLLGLVVLSAFGGRKVHAINVAVKKEMQPLRVATRTLRRFIADHRHEPGFSIAFDGSVYGATENCHGIPLSVILFKRCLDNHHPRYVFSLERGVLVPHRHDGHSQVFPDLVKVGTVWNYYWYDGWYHAVAASEGFCRPERIDDARAVKDRSLQGAEDQVARKLSGHPADRKGRSVSLHSSGR
jgi:hypothetical protein